jgi:replicative DNA helicase
MNVDQSVNVLDIESELIRHLVNKEALQRIIKENISDELLIRPKCKEALAFARHYYIEHTDAPSPQIMNTEFPQFMGQVNFFGNKTEVSISWLVNKIRDRYKRKEIHDLSLELGELWNTNKTDEAIRLLRVKSVEIDRASLSHNNQWETSDYKNFIGLVQDEVIRDLYKGFSTGFPRVDQYTGGLKPGYLAFLAARPKRMKSFFLIQSFIEQIKQGHRPIFFTLELTHKEIMLRFMCMVTGFPWDRAQRGDFGSKKEWEGIENKWKDFCDQYGSAIVVQPPSDERSVQQLMMQADKANADSIFISQLKYITPLKYHRSSHESYAEIVLDLKQEAVKTGKERPLYVEAQFNREAQNIQELQELDLAQLGLTDAIGQTADVVYSIVQTNDMYNSGQAEMGVVEARNHGKTSWMFQSEFKINTYLKCLGTREELGI